MKFSSKKELKKIIYNLNLNKSKIYLLHVSLIDLGLFEDIIPENICNFIFSELKKKMPSKSTFFTMSPNYDYSKKQPFKINSSYISKEIGSFARYFYSLKGSIRSNNPIFNLCGNGPNAKKILEDCSPTAFGYDSAWHKLFKNNCEMIFIGCDLSRCTFIRFIEFNFGVPYIFNKYFDTKIINKRKIINQFTINQLRFLNSNLEYNTKKFENELRKKNYLFEVKNKKFKLMQITMKNAYKVGLEQLNKNPFFFLKKKPVFSKFFTPYN